MELHETDYLHLCVNFIKSLITNSSCTTILSPRCQFYILEAMVLGENMYTNLYLAGQMV